MLPRSRCARTPSALRRWFRFAWLDRVPLLAAWLRDRLRRPPRTADHRREPRRPVLPAISQLETRWVPNDVMGLLPRVGLATPFLVLMKGWGVGQLLTPELPPVAPATTSPTRVADSRPTAVDAVFAAAPARPAAPAPAAPAPAASSATVAPAAAPAGQASAGGDGLASPLGADWLRAVDDLFGGPPARPAAGASPAGHGTGEGGGGSSGASAFAAPAFGLPASGGGGSATSPAADLASLAGLGGTGRGPTAGAAVTSISPTAPLTAAAPAGHATGPVKLRFVADGVQGGAGATPPPQAQPNFGRIPLAFTQNVGQTDPSVGYLSRGPGFSLFLTGGSAVLSLPLPPAQQQAPTDRDVLRLNFAGASASPLMTGEQQLPSVSSYYVGSDPAAWHPDVANYARVVAHNVYPGIDVAFYGTNSRTLEYDFIVHAGADPNAIRLGWQGVTGLSTDQQGNLDLQTAGGTVVQNAPAVYQAGSGGSRQAVSAGTVLEQDGTVGFSVGTYDATKDLIIDPVLGFSSYLGGSGSDYAYGVAVDPATGNVVVAGKTNSANFPTTTGVLRGSNAGGYDAFVSKLSPDGSRLIYSSYLGGSSDDWATAVAVDAAGNCAPSRNSCRFLS